MKKTTLLFIPIVLSVMPLTGCKDYKFDDPKAIFRNRDTSIKGVRLKCPYVTNADSILEHTYITDIENIVVKSLNKASFKSGSLKVDDSNRFLEFSCNSYNTEKTMGSADFKVYDNGYLIYKYEYIADLENLKMNSQTFRFTFDSSIAKSLIEKVDVEFEKSKAEEDRILATLTTDNFFTTLGKRKREVTLYESSGRKKGEYYDNGDVLKELKALDYTLLDGRPDLVSSAFPVSLANARTEKDGSYFNYEGGIASWSLSINADGTFAYMDYFGRDCFDKFYNVMRYYSLNPEQALSAIDNIFTISDNLRVSTNF